MEIRFATKRDINGNRIYLGIDTAAREYARMPHGFLCKGDFVEVTRKELHQLLQKCIDDEYMEVTSM